MFLSCPEGCIKNALEVCGLAGSPVFTYLDKGRWENMVKLLKYQNSPLKIT